MEWNWETSKGEKTQVGENWGTLKGGKDTGGRELGDPKGELKRHR